MRLLVTGASGLVGRHVAAAAADNPGIELVASARSIPDFLPAGADFLAADLSDAEQAERLVREICPTHLIHCAWETRHPTYYEALENEDWVTSAARMAAAFADVGGQRFVQVGSCAEYDWTGKDGPPASRYGRAKLAGFAAIEAAASGKFEAVEARIFWVYGPGENPARLIPYICRRHIAGEVPQLGSGRQERDLLHAADSATALLSLARADGLTGVVEIGGGCGTRLAEVATILARIAGRDETGLGLRPERADDPAQLVADTARLRSTGWAPKVGLEQGLAEIYRRSEVEASGDS